MAENTDAEIELAALASLKRVRYHDNSWGLPSWHGSFQWKGPFSWCVFRAGKDRQGPRVTWWTEGTSFRIEVEKEERTPVVFGAGRPILSTLLQTPVGLYGGVPIFVSHRGAEAATKWLSVPEHAALVTAMDISEGEQLLVTQHTQLLCHRQGLDADLARLDKMLALIGALPAGTPA